MATVWAILALVFGAIVLTRWHLRVSARRLGVVRRYDEVHFARTDDGVRLALHRYRAPVTADAPPVVLCHGIAANRYNLDLDDDHSLALHLHREGRDVWLLELRGCGWSEGPARGADRRREPTFDDFVRHDLPAALRAVEAATGATAVDWVGFSMGGLLAYAHLARSAASRRPDIRRLVTIGSPVSTRPARTPGVLGLLARLTRPLPVVWLAAPARFLAFATRLLLPLDGGVVTVRGATDGAVLRRAMANVVTDISRGVVRQLEGWLTRGTFASEDGRDDYGAGLAGVRVPALVIGGSADRLAHPRMVEAGFAQLGGASKRLLVVGRPQGQRTDYGHVDLVLGRHAAEEVFPIVSAFLGATTETATVPRPELAPTAAQGGG